MEEHPSLFYLTFLFLIVLDPLGNLPIFISYLKGFDAKRQRRIILREMLAALIVMVLFFFFGKNFFALIHIDQASLALAGGIILFIIGVKMLFTAFQKVSQNKEAKEPLIVPLAVPSVAGPGILAMISLYGATDSKLYAFCAIILSWLILLPILLLASILKGFLGDKGLQALEQLFGYLIILIASQMALNGTLMILK